MVFEQIFKVNWIEKKPRHAFILGMVYSLIGILSAKLIFGSSTGLMAVAFTSILLIPSLNRLLRDEENVEIREKKFHIKQLFKDHKDIFEIYIFLFLGIFVTFAAVTLLFSQATILKMFAPQLKVAGITGQATNLFGMASGGFTVMSILKNNLLILFVCLILSLVYGAGSILFITWNATVWGVVFGYFVKESASAAGQNPFLAFGIAVLPFLPHMITEALAYFTASISGGVVSKAMIREKLFSKKFHHVLTDGLIILGLGLIIIIIAAIIEVKVYPLIS